MTLFGELNEIADAINQQSHLIKTEADTVQVSVYPFIQALGYKPFNLNDVKPQFTADPRPSGGERVDYAIMRQGKPIILIEAKSINISLSENHWRQLHDYFNSEEVQFGILTNGLEYRFYTDFTKRNIMDKEPFLVLDMLQLDERLVTELQSFERSRFSLDHALFSAQKLTISRLIQREFTQPSDELVKYIANSISCDELTNSQIQRYTSVVKVALRELIENKVSNDNLAVTKQEPVSREIIAQKPNTDVQPVNASNQNNTRAKSNVSQLIEIPVFGNYLGVEYEAILLFNPLSKDGDTYSMSLTKIRWRGEIVSVNEAEFRAIRSVNPELKLEQWKGWNTWKLRDPETGTLRAIRDLLKDSELRDQFL